MPTPAEYLEAAHLMAKGRAHRIADRATFEEEESPAGTVGAWVPIEVWITAEELAQIQELERRRLAQEDRDDGSHHA